MSEHQATETSKNSDNAIKQNIQSQPVLQQPHPSAIIQRVRSGINTHTDVLYLQRTIGNQAVTQLITEIGRSAQNIQLQEFEEEEEDILQGECLQCQVPEEEEELIQADVSTEPSGSLQEKTRISKNNSDIIQKNPVAPALSLAGIGAALTSSSVSQAATMAGLLLGAGAAASSVGASIMPGATGVQSVSLENGWMSNRDKQNLELIIRYKIVNAYIERFAQNNHDLFNTPEEIREAEENEEMLFPPDVINVGGPAPEDARTEAGANELVDSTILEAVKISVRREIEQTLNTNQKTAPDQEYIWSDSGDHTADWFGTVGAIVFTDVRGTFINETLVLNSYARQIPNLTLPLEGEIMDVRQFRGGTMRRSPIMETGLNDELGINLSGSGPDINSADNVGHGIHIYKTDWNWDDKTTQGDFGLKINEDGTPEFNEPVWRGVPED